MLSRGKLMQDLAMAKKRKRGNGFFKEKESYKCLWIIYIHDLKKLSKHKKILDI